MRHPTIAAVLALALSAAPLLLRAQDSTRTAPRLCYRGRPAPACTRFVLTEIGYYARAAGSSSSFIVPGSGDQGRPDFPVTLRDISPQVSWELGLMSNRGPKSALGATVLIGAGGGDGGAEVGLKARYRRWLGDNGLAIDVGSGLFAGSLTAPNGRANGAGITGDVALNAADYGAVVVRFDALRADDRTATALYTGVRLGSKPALGATGLLAAFVILVGTAVATADQ